MSSSKRSRPAARQPWTQKPAGRPQGESIDESVERDEEAAPPPRRSSSAVARRYPIGKRDGVWLGALGVVILGAVLVKTLGGHGELAQENERLSTQLAPFLEAARRAYPGEEDDAALKKLAERVASGGAVPSGAAGMRGISASQRAAMVARLAAEAAPGKRAWISVLTSNADAVAFGKWLEGVFQEAGWPVETSAWPGQGLKPGVFFFAAEEQNPEWVDTARGALEEAGGLKMMVASGYRSYYAEKKKQNPDWVGVDMKPGQAFAIVVGPKEDPNAKKDEPARAE